jgi:hypothetical protein
VRQVQLSQAVASSRVNRIAGSVLYSPGARAPRNRLGPRSARRVRGASISISISISFSFSFSFSISRRWPAP